MMVSVTKEKKTAFRDFINFVLLQTSIDLMDTCDIHKFSSVNNLKVKTNSSKYKVRNCTQSNQQHIFQFTPKFK